MKKTLLLSLLAVATLAAGACAAESPEPELTRRQKDSIIADLPIPGAGGVGRALEALGQTEDRAARHDSLSASIN